jgi:hypothetical protein
MIRRFAPEGTEYPSAASFVPSPCALWKVRTVDVAAALCGVAGIAMRIAWSVDTGSLAPKLA